MFCVWNDEQVELTVLSEVIVPDVGPVHLHELVIRGEDGQFWNPGKSTAESQRIHLSPAFGLHR